MEDLLSLLVVIGVIWLVASIARDIVCWPFKINNRIEMMQKMLDNQEKIINLLTKQSGEAAPAETKDSEAQS